jgi:CheY-like chemotaxis protein
MEKIDVLLIEDTATQAIIMQQMLESLGVSVHIKKTAEEALAYLELVEPKLILTDINLPEMDGFEMTSLIKSSSRFGHIPVVMLIAFRAREDLFEIINSGADNFMMKILKRDYFIPAFKCILDSLENGANTNDTARANFSFSATQQELEFCPQKVFNMLLSCFDTVVSQQRTTADNNK